MWTSIDLCLIPLGVGISLSPYIAECKKVLDQSGLDYEIGPNGTAIEGEWNDVFNCVQACHKIMHNKGVERIYATVKVNTRTDKQQSFREKVPSLHSVILDD